MLIVWHETDERRVISANYFELFLPGLGLLRNSPLTIDADWVTWCAGKSPIC